MVCGWARPATAIPTITSTPMITAISIRIRMDTTMTMRTTMRARMPTRSTARSRSSRESCRRTIGWPNEIAVTSRRRGLYVVNVLASPGAGKTAFIERTAADLGGRFRLGVIVGDLATENDAIRLRGHGIPAIQITTGSVCHLDAEMVSRAMERLDLNALDVLVIENVGNLVCPAVYDLGESARIVLLSVTEGEDKPLKYPVMFQSAQVVVVNKMDIAAAVGFDRETALRNIRRAAPHAMMFEVSARTGEGMDAWYQYLREHLHARQPGLSQEPGEV